MNRAYRRSDRPTREQHANVCMKARSVGVRTRMYCGEHELHRMARRSYTPRDGHDTPCRRGETTQRQHDRSLRRGALHQNECDRLMRQSGRPLMQCAGTINRSCNALSPDVPVCRGEAHRRIDEPAACTEQAIVKTDHPHRRTDDRTGVASDRSLCRNDRSARRTHRTAWMTHRTCRYIASSPLNSRRDRKVKVIVRRDSARRTSEEVTATPDTRTRRTTERRQTNAERIRHVDANDRNVR
jgi:hypothetical protein